MERFTLKSFMFVFDIAKTEDATFKLLHWLQRGVIRTVASEDDELMYEYVDRAPGKNPTHKPRGEFDVQRMVNLWREQNHIVRGEAVARTGRPMGSTGKAGRDKRMMKAGKMTQKSRAR